MSGIVLMGLAPVLAFVLMRVFRWVDRREEEQRQGAQLPLRGADPSAGHPSHPARAR